MARPSPPRRGRAGDDRRCCRRRLRQRIQRQRRTSRRPATADLQILIGSSGDAETNAVKAAAAAWASSTGNTATVTPAQDIGQQLGQAFAGGTPPDVFYVDASRFADYASVGALEPYARQGQGRRRRLLPVAAYQPFTYQDKLYCVPKDFSTLALQINTDLWTKAKLTDADIPTTWDQLTAVAAEAQGGRHHAAGHRRHPRPDRRLHGRGRRLDRQQGRHARRPPTRPQNLQALQYVQGLLKQRAGGLPEAGRRRLGRRGVRQGQGRDDDRGQLDQGRDADRLPDHQVHGGRRCRPARRAKGTLSFTQCWGISAKSKYKDQAIDFVEAMTTGPAAARVRQGVRRDAVAAVGQGQLPAAVPERPGVHRQRGLRPGAGQRPEDGPACCPTSTASCRASPPVTRRRSWPGCRPTPPRRSRADRQ